MGGGEFALLEHARYLVEKNASVHVLLFHQGPFAKRLTEEGCHVHVIQQRLDCGPKGFYLKELFLAPKLKRLLREVDPDYVVCYTLAELPFVASSAKALRIPILFRDQGAPRPNEAMSDWRDLRLASWTKAWLAGVIPTTSAETNRLLANGAAKNRVKKVFYAVASSEESQACESLESVRDELRIPVNTPIVGIFGRLVAWKGQEVFLDALARCGCDNVHGLVVGGIQLNEDEGPKYEASLHQKASNLGIADRIHFTGFRNDTARLMSSCDVVCHASEREPFGLVIVEAMMRGKPVIASDVSGPRESVVPGETGYLVAPGDSATMAKHIGQLIADPTLARRMGTAGRLRALDLFERSKNLAELDRTIWEFVNQDRSKRSSNSS